MKEETTNAGRLYGVCSAGECIVTDAETGLVLATLDGSKQEAFIAPGSLVYISDDAAVVTELFKLAPCRGVVAKLLLRKAGGWLPAGFTELEYLWSSGTQYIDLGWFNPATYKGRILFILPTNIASLSGARCVCGGQNAPLGSSSFNWGQSVMQQRGNGSPGIMYNMSAWQPNVVLGELNEVVIDVKNYSWNGQKFLVPEDFVCDSVKMMLFAASERDHRNMLSVGVKVLRFTWSDASHNYDLVPVLDDTGTPCMYDKVSKQCFRNLGTGTFGYRIKRTGETHAPMSLRDPYYVPPSGVYARRVGENELEVLADTEEATGEGWEWFSNTAEAYEHFGITQEDELLTE